MNNFGSYNPVVARPQDGELITLCRILDTLALNSGAEQAPVTSPAITGGVTTAGTNAYVVNCADISTLTFSSTPSTSPAPASGSQITIYGSVDGVKYLQTSFTALTTGGTASVFAATSQTIGQINCVGLSYIAFAISTAITTGSVVITTVGANGVSNVMLDNPLPAGSNVIGGVATQAASGSLTMTNSNVGTSSATLLAANSATKSLTIQNTHATQTLYVSTTTPATNLNGIAIAAGIGYQFPFVPTNALYCLGSGATTTYTLWYA